MENREDLNSILPFLPLILRSSSLFWPPKAIEALKGLSRGPDFSGVDSGSILFDAILDLRDSLGLSRERLAFSASDGYSLFFDDLMSRAESHKWFGEIIPAVANLLLRLPSLLEDHYSNADNIFGEGKDGLKIKSGLRLLDSQEAGIVLLSQELISALLACSLFCLFPILIRSGKDLPTINCDYLFACLYPNAKQSQENKIKCLLHYFERICSCMPAGFVSFERKVLQLKRNSLCTSYPDADFWSTSIVPLCSFKISYLGFIEDQQYEAIEVDFANKYIGGGALHTGCVQEEIRFMINPELIVGMLFMPAMEDNEAIEIVGAERFSNYRGYAASFTFTGDYLDKKPVNSLGRRKTRIAAIDALCNPRMRQYRVEGLLRETNKAFCGFLDQRKYHHYTKIIQEHAIYRDSFDQDMDGLDVKVGSIHPNPEEMLVDTGDSMPVMTSNDRTRHVELITNFSSVHGPDLESQDCIGVATGNWGCGAFGGDPELKSMMQWLAASQAQRPFILYYTFGETALQRLEEVSQWILSHEWTVGDLWSMVVDYSSKRLKGHTCSGFLDWLLPSLEDNCSAIGSPFTS